MGTELPLLQKPGRRRLGWRLPEAVAAAAAAPTEGSDDPSKVPPDSELSEAPELSEIRPKDI